ncbi:methyltransferase [Streptomyces buecherae]
MAGWRARGGRCRAGVAGERATAARRVVRPQRGRGARELPGTARGNSGRVRPAGRAPTAAGPRRRRPCPGGGHRHVRAHHGGAAVALGRARRLARLRPGVRAPADAARPRPPGDSPRTGETGLDTVYGAPFFDHLATRPELSRQFNSAMSEVIRLTAAQLPDHHDFEGFQHVVDVGGGDGTLLASVPRRFRTPRGTVHDRADGLAQAPDKLAEPGLTGRCELAVGDFFASVPAGADLYPIT